MTEHELKLIRNRPDEGTFLQLGRCSCGVPMDARSNVSRRDARRGAQKNFIRHLERVRVA